MSTGKAVMNMIAFAIVLSMSISYLILMTTIQENLHPIPHKNFKQIEVSNVLNQLKVESQEKEKKPFIVTPIDLVYTWVNGSDIYWKKSRDGWYKKWVKELHYNDSSEQESRILKLDNRFRDNSELLYSLRSVEKYANWVRHIFIVTADGQIPNWLDTTNPRISIIHHSAIFPPSHLPSFSSHAIESNIVNIPGLSDNFILLSDDVMFGAPVDLSDFFVVPGIQKIYLSNWVVPACNRGCSLTNLLNTRCDSICNTESCNFDNGACAPHNNSRGKKVDEMYLLAHYYMEMQLSKRFPRVSRRIFVAHCPHLFNRRYFQALKTEFKEIEETSSHRFRQANDFQIQFAYYNFLLENKELKLNRATFEEIWDLLIDKNHDGLVSLEEAKEAARHKHVRGIPLSDFLVKYLNRRNSSQESFEALKTCCKEDIITTYEKCVAISKHTAIRASKQVTFEMIDDNFAGNVKKLQNIELHPTKFITLNDDAKNSSIKLYTLRQLFYNNMFPLPSSFERKETSFD